MCQDVTVGEKVGAMESHSEEPAAPRPPSLAARALRSVQPEQQSAPGIESYFRDGLVLAADDASDDKNRLLTWWGMHSQESAVLQSRHETIWQCPLLEYL